VDKEREKEVWPENKKWSTECDYRMWCAVRTERKKEKQDK
jgi:hypothetical protein